jgi:hypothetical protein
LIITGWKKENNMLVDYVSQTMLGGWYRCPEQFRRRWIEGEIIPPGIAARKGSAAHKAAEINHRQKIKTKTDLPLGDLTDAARDEYVKLVKDQGIFIPREEVSAKCRLLADGLDSAVRLTETYHREMAPRVKPLYVEEILFLDVGLSLPLRGILDLVTEDFAMEDIKTSSKAKSQSEVDASLQLTFYSGLFAGNNEGKWPSICRINNLIDNSKSYLKTFETRRDEKDFKALIIRIEFMLAQIKTGLFPPCEPTSWACNEKWCGFALTCKYYRR